MTYTKTFAAICWFGFLVFWILSRWVSETSFDLGNRAATLSMIMVSAAMILTAILELSAYAKPKDNNHE